MADADCTRTHICAYCGTEFVSRKSNHKYCSVACNQAAYRVRKTHDPAGHKCHECGARFTGRKKKYCSSECSASAKVKRDRKRKGLNPNAPPKYKRVANRLEYPLGIETEAQKRQWRYSNDMEYRAKEKARQSIAKNERRYKKKLADDGTVTAAHIERRKTCLYCGTKLTRQNRTLDHMVPVVAGGAHSVSNVVECCRSCNSSKGAGDFLDWLGLLDPPHRERTEREWVKRKGAPPQQAPLFG